MGEAISCKKKKKIVSMLCSCVRAYEQIKHIYFVFSIYRENVNRNFTEIFHVAHEQSEYAEFTIYRNSNSRNVIRLGCVFFHDK